MLKKLVSYSLLGGAIAIGAYAYFHFNADQKEGHFSLDYLYPNADYIIELNAPDQGNLPLTSLSNILPQACKANKDYPQILAALDAAQFQKAYLAVFNCDKTCLLLESSQNLNRLDIPNWEIKKAAKDRWLIQDGDILTDDNLNYDQLSSFLKPIKNARAIVKNKEGIYSVHEIQNEKDNFHFTGFVLDESNKKMAGANMDLNAVTALLPKACDQFVWQALAEEDTEFKENELNEFIHFSIPNGSREVSYTALRMKINSNRAQKTFKVANSSIGSIGNSKWMEDQIPQMKLASHYSLFRDWIVCASSKDDLETFARVIKKGGWNKNADFPLFQSKLGMNLNSLEYKKLDGGAMEIVQNVYTTEGQHYNIIDVLDPNDDIQLADNLEQPEPIEPDNFELREIADSPIEPFEFINHYTRAIEWVIQDDDLNLVLMDANKEIIFKRKLDSPVMGDFKMVDALKNNKYQLLFNTEKFIYLIDRKGRNVENFPIELDDLASNELAVLDYEQNQNYRLVIGLDNGSVLNYGIDGKRIKGWKYEHSDKAIIYPVTHMRMGSKDYLFTLNEDYEIKLLDRRGKERHPLQAQPEDLDNLAIEIFKENSIQNSGIRYKANGQEKEFVFGKASS
ncbi:MAG: hypothetical protein AAF487_03115 [Bacteroidota bacterium]